jgi:hypothetical protein
MGVLKREVVSPALRRLDFSRLPVRAYAPFCRLIRTLIYMKHSKPLGAAFGLLLGTFLCSLAHAEYDFALVSSKVEAAGEKCAGRPYLYQISSRKLTGNGVQVQKQNILVCTDRELTLADAEWMSSLRGPNSIGVEYDLVKKPGDQQL